MASLLGGKSAVGWALGALFTLASCTHEMPTLGPPGALPDLRRAPRSIPPAEWYWEPVEAEAHASSTSIELPVRESALTRVEGATRVWDELGGEGRDRLLRDGLLVVAGPDTFSRMGAFYMHAREQRVPYVVTLDALAYATHVAFERALSELDDETLAPALEVLLPKLEARLAAEQKGAGSDLAEALGLARALVAVARALSADAGSASEPPAPGPALSPELTAAVDKELARIVAHAGPAASPLLGVPIDYARFAVPAGAARPGAFRAMAWLASAPLVLVAQTEVRRGVIGVARARLHARAAMVLTRVTMRDVDPAIHAVWSRMARVLAFVWGPPDDLSGPELAEVASAIGVAVEDPKEIANVVSVDRVRRRAAQGRVALAFDGAGAPGRAGTAVRLFGGHAPADSVTLASLAGPTLGTATSAPPPILAREGMRALPSSLDLAAWLGAKEGRAAVREAGFDAFTGYEAALAYVISRRPAEDASSRHASVHGSLVDVMMTWLAPEPTEPRALSSAAAQRAAIESALAAWTYARHDGQPFARPRPSRAPRLTRELEVKGAPLPAFVEVAPDVIARLVATASQMKRGLKGVGGLSPTSPAMTSLAEVEDILRLALRIATQEAGDLPLAAEHIAALASMPARLARLEESGEGSEVPVVAEIAVDAAGERSLSSATGLIEPAVTVFREPGTDRLLLAVGAHVAHHELIEPRAKRSTDDSHRAQLARGRGGPSKSKKVPGLPGRAAYTGAFRLVVVR